MSQRFFRIHPGVGVARVGNSPNEFFIGPERPGERPNCDITTGKFGTFKDSQGRIKRQAARFRIFEYVLQGTKLVPKGEVNADGTDVLKITWKVSLANRKAAFFQFNGKDGENGVWKGSPADKGKPRANLRNPNVTNRETLVIAPGEKTTSGPDAAPVPFTNPNAAIPVIKSLGELRTDKNGNLLVLGGSGESGTTLPVQDNRIVDYANNDSWFDDTSDGPVSAVVEFMLDGKKTTTTLDGANGAWVLVGPPDFAPAVGNVIRLLDTMWDVAVRNKAAVPLDPNDGLYDQGLLALLKAQRDDWDAATNTFKTYKPSFLREVYPLLERALLVRNVHDPEASKSFHGSMAGVEQDLGSVDSSRGRRLRRTLFGYMRNPASNSHKEPLLMPKGLGDNFSDEFEWSPTAPPRPDYFMSLTRVQYAVLARWADGEFVPDWDEAKANAKLQKAVTAHGLDLAALENSVGGPFFPGIDCSWLVRRPELYAAPLRFKHKGEAFPAVTNKDKAVSLSIRPGFFSQQMALPWQADFYDCRKAFFRPEGTGYEGDGMYHMWWAAHRPDDVYARAGDLKMVPWARSIEQAARVQAKDPKLKLAALASTLEDMTAEDLAMYIQMQKNWADLGFVIQDGASFFETEKKPDPGT